MKKNVRIVLALLLLLAGGAMLTLYFVRKRSVPEQARCIPSDAMAVLTLNIRELALDLSAGRSPEQEKAGPPMMNSRFGFLLRAAENNGGSGISPTDDITGFFYQENDAAYIGFAIQLGNAKKFESLLLGQLAKTYPMQKLPATGITLIRLDSISGAIGFDNETAVLIFPFSDHDNADAARQCDRLLKLKPEQSLLVNENFREHELQQFDAAAWFQAAPLLHFTGGGNLPRQLFSNLDYAAISVDFREGEISMRRSLTPSKGKTINAPKLSTLPFAASDIKGFSKFLFGRNTDDEISLSAGSAPFRDLPFSEEELEQIIPLLDGNGMILAHDSIRYMYPEIITYPDAPADTVLQNKTVTACSYCFGVKNKNALTALLTKILGPPDKNGMWPLAEEHPPMRIFFSGNQLVVSQCTRCNPAEKPMPELWQAREAELSPAGYFNDDFGIKLLATGMGMDWNRLNEQLGVLTIMNRIPQGNNSCSNMQLTLKKKESNALVQLEAVFLPGAQRP
jgi:hypothetical protein